MVDFDCKAAGDFWNLSSYARNVVYPCMRVAPNDERPFGSERLIDGAQLSDLLRTLKLGVRTELVETVIVKADWFARL